MTDSLDRSSLVKGPESPTGQEERPGSGAHLQIFLPDIRFDVARALLEFLYTGDLRRALGLDSPLPYDLRAAAKTYGVPRLEALCTEAISLGMDPRGRDRGNLASRNRREWNQVRFLRWKRGD